jgi:TetR/AcrR family transcriptional regulator, regulator of autoinduction and epiphytic fitness
MPVKQRLTDRKRAAIIHAAIAEFRANGFDATSVDKVAARAEVSKRTLYNHFPSKEDLFAETLRALWQNSITKADAPYRAGAPVREQLVGLLMQRMAMLSDGSFLAWSRVAIAAFIHSPKRAQGMIKRLDQRDGGLVGWISAAHKAGRLKVSDPSLAAQLMASIVKGAAYWPQVTMGRPPLAVRERRKVAAAAADLFLSHYSAKQK